MKDWQINALDRLKAKLKERVIIKNGLNDKLSQAADGFMTPAEVSSAVSKPNNAEQMEELIRILRGKSSKDFSTFCSILRQVGYSHWASELEREGRKFKRKAHTHVL